jgi:hypothetical protein
MMRVFISLLTLFSLSSLSFAQEPLRGSVSQSWTVDMAREEAFKNINLNIDPSLYPNIDPNLIENWRLRQNGGGKIQSRLLTSYNDGYYSVSELCDLRSFYYKPDGSVEKVDINSSASYTDESCPSTIPMKSYTYALGTYVVGHGSTKVGNLVSIVLHTDVNDAFIFNPDGTLSAHWKNNNCYKPDGSKCGFRQGFTD